MIVNNSTGGGGDSGIRDVVFRLALIEDPNNERVASNFANRVNVGPVSPLPGLNLPGGSSGPSIGPSAGGYTGRTGGGTAGSTGNYSEDMKRINEARKAAEDLITKMRVEAERKIGEERKRALEVVTRLEEEAAKKINEQKKRYDDEEQRRKEKSWRNELKWNEMVRQEREKQLRAEGRDYASRYEGGQSASYQRMQQYIGRQGWNRRMSGGSFGEALEGATQIGRAGVLAANSFGMDTTEILHNVMLAEAGFSAAKGSYKMLKYAAGAGVPGAVGMYAAGGKVLAGGKALAGAAWGGATSTVGAPLVIAAGFGMGLNSIYETATGKRGGANDWVAENLGYNRFFDSMMRGDNDKTLRMQQNMAYDMQERQFGMQMRSQRENMRIANFRHAAQNQEWEATWSGSRINREIYGDSRAMALAEMRGFDVTGLQNRIVQGIGIRNNAVGSADIMTMREQQQSLRGQMGDMSEQQRLEAQKQIHQIELQIANLRENQKRSTMETLEAMRRGRLEEAQNLRMMGEDKMAAFGMLGRGDQEMIKRAKMKLDEGKQLSPNEERMLMQFAGPEAMRKLRDNQIEKGRRAGGDLVFGNDFENAAKIKDKLAEDIKKELEKVGGQLDQIASVFGKSLADMFQGFVDQTFKAAKENQMQNEKAKAANVPK